MQIKDNTMFMYWFLNTVATILDQFLLEYNVIHTQQTRPGVVLFFETGQPWDLCIMLFISYYGS